MKILFVDDEPAILRTLRRTLRHLPKSDQIDLESDPLAAMERLQRNDYDLVISDMRMPRCSGHQVLAQAARCNPRCVRAVLSGYSGEEETAKAVHYAHLFIAKPFDPNTITDLIERARTLQSMPLSDPLRRCLGGLKALPPIPKLFTTLNQALTGDPNAASLEDIAAILGQDIVMASKILQLANSSFFGGRTTVMSVEQAVKLLGILLLSGLVLQHELFAKSNLPDPLESWREELNRESLATAALAARIAQQQGLDSAQCDEAYLAGLLHDVGRLALVAESPSIDIAKNLRNIQRGSELCREEEALFGSHHGWAGAYLLRLWGFSEAVVNAVAWHHHPSRSGIEGFSTLTLTHVADALTRSESDGMAELDHEYLQRIGCHGELDAWRALSDSEAPKQP
jgi:putative nucleotidyltransferase with HDIG domain